MSPRFLQVIAALTVLALAPAQQASARGFGGFHGGGGRGGFNRGGGFDRGGFNGGGFDRSGFDRGGFGGEFGGGGFNRGFASETGRTTSGFRGPEGFGDRFGADGRGVGEGAAGARPDRAELNRFLGLPSDEGFGNFAAGAAAPRVEAPHGSVAGPRGGQAAGIGVEGPRGNELVRGAAAGPNGGVEAGRGVVGAEGGVAGHGIAAGPEDRVAAGAAVHGPEGVGAARGAVAGPAGVVAGATRFSPAGRYATGAAVRSNFHAYGLYGRGWYAEHPHAWLAAGTLIGSAWTAATWNSVGAWFDYPVGAPTYGYDYGNDIVYQDDSVYFSGQPGPTAAQYYDQATTIAEAHGADPADVEGPWLPLGVFALSHSDGDRSSLIFQLAVNKNGLLHGNYTDMASDQTSSVQGAVDRKSQRAAWTIGENKRTVIETGIYNLTQDEAPTLIHYGPERTEQWLLVRLRQPEEKTPVPAADVSAPAPRQ